MTRRVELADGAVLEFPDETPDAVIDQTVKRHISGVDTEEGKQSYLRGLGQSLAQGLTLGFSDEITGLMTAVAAEVGDILTPGNDGQSFGQVYRETAQAEREGQQQFAEDNPKTALGAEIAGGVVSGGAGGARVAGFLPLGSASRSARLAVSGAVPGAAYGAGAADPGERGAGAVQGAVLGGAVGAATPALAGVASKAVSALGNMAATPFRGAPTKALRKINQAFQRDEVSATRAGRNQALLGEDASLMDIGGANVRGLAESAANQPGKAMNQAQNFLRGRQGKQRENLITAVKSKLSSQAEDLQGATDEIVTRMRTEAAPLYEAAYSAPLKNNQALQRLLENPQVKPLLKKAIKSAKSDVTLPDKFKAGLDPENPNLVVWDYVKRELADKSFKAGGNRGRILKGIEKAIIKQLDEQVPDYKAARNVWSDNAKQLDALEKGKNIFKDIRKDPDFSKAEFAKLSEDQKELFRLGAGRTLINLIKNVDDTLEGVPPASVMKQIFGSPAKREALQTIFPDQKEFRQFSRALSAERTYHSNANQALANSRTAVRQAMQDDAGIDVSAAGELADAARGRLSGVIGVLKRMGGKNSEAVNKELAERFFTNDAAVIKDTLQQMQAQGNILPKWAQTVMAMDGDPLLKWLNKGNNREQLIGLLSGASGTGAVSLQVQE